MDDPEKKKRVGVGELTFFQLLIILKLDGSLQGNWGELLDQSDVILNNISDGVLTICLNF